MCQHGAPAAKHPLALPDLGQARGSRAGRAPGMLKGLQGQQLLPRSTSQGKEKVKVGEFLPF